MKVKPHQDNIDFGEVNIKPTCRAPMSYEEYDALGKQEVCKEIEIKVNSLVEEILDYLARNIGSITEDQLEYLFKAQSLLAGNPCTEVPSKKNHRDNLFKYL